MRITQTLTHARGMGIHQWYIAYAALPLPLFTPRFRLSRSIASELIQNFLVSKDYGTIVVYFHIELKSIVQTECRETRDVGDTIHPTRLTW